MCVVDPESCRVNFARAVTATIEWQLLFGGGRVGCLSGTDVDSIKKTREFYKLLSELKIQPKTTFSAALIPAALWNVKKAVCLGKKQKPFC